MNTACFRSKKGQFVLNLAHVVAVMEYNEAVWFKLASGAIVIVRGLVFPIKEIFDPKVCRGAPPKELIVESWKYVKEGKEDEQDIQKGSDKEA